MANYYKKSVYNKNKPKSKSKSKKKNYNRDAKNIVRSIIALFAIFGIISGILTFFNIDWDKSTNNDDVENTTQYVDVHIVPGDNWAADCSSYGAWCWNDSGVPAAVFVLATDEDGDGVHTVRVSNEFSNILFVDLVPGATELGASWVNKREQTNNLLVPNDDNVYYHIYASEWTNTSDLMFAPTTEEVSVVINANAWDVMNKPVMYCFDKTGVSEPCFVEMTQCGAHDYLATVPVGYTHVIFIEYSDNTYMGSWDEIVHQTADLIIPTGEARYFNTETNEWYVPVEE